MPNHSPISSRERLRRSAIYAIVAVSASAIALLMMAFLGSRTRSQVPGTSITDIASYALGIALLPGWLPIRGMFERVGSCSSLDQILGPALLIPFVSVVIDTGLIFGVWELFQRMTSGGLDSDNILHIDR
jgi:hypothetical protein